MSTPAAALDEAEFQQLILAEIKDDGTVSKVMPKLWKLYSAWSAYNSVDGLFSLQYLKVRAHALFILMGSVRLRIPFQARDRRQDLDKLFEYLKEMRQETLLEIDTALLQYVQGDGIAVDQTDVSLPNIDNRYYNPQPDDLRYTGVPFLPSLRLP